MKTSLCHLCDTCMIYGVWQVLVKDGGRSTTPNNFHMYNVFRQYLKNNFVYCAQKSCLQGLQIETSGLWCKEKQNMVWFGIAHWEGAHWGWLHNTALSFTYFWDCTAVCYKDDSFLSWPHLWNKIETELSKCVEQYHAIISSFPYMHCGFT